MKYLGFFLLFPLYLSAQLSDDFSSGSLENWEGDTEKFIINAAQELQLKDTSENAPASLFRVFPMRDSTLWEVYIRNDFAPSNANFTQIILWSNRADASNFEGYFLKLGGISGNDDAIEFFRKDGETVELLLSGTLGAVANAPLEVRIQVTRDTEGLWTLLADYEGERNFIIEGSILDNRYTSGQFFGLACEYTSTRSDKFFFDDLNISTQQDEQAPELLSVEVTNSRLIRLQFNEALANEAATTDLNNFQISPEIEIEQVIRESNNNLLLRLATDLQNLTTYTVFVQDIEDLAGNVVQNASLSFQYIEPVRTEFGEILINEIMADPSPAIGQPEVEYIELYNNSDKSINLEGFEIADIVKKIELPDYLLAPRDYVVLYEGDGSDFVGLNNVLGLEDFIGLSNSIEELELKNPDNELIHSVKYNLLWYRDVNKDDGGFSLELINPAAICEQGASNWRASDSPTGGTPGSMNSVLEEVVDERFLGIESFILIGDQQIELFFAESVVENVANNPDNYEIEALNVVEAVITSLDFTSARLTLDRPLEKNQIYTLSLSQDFTDCLGNTSDSLAVIRIALADAADAQDLVINEILFNPETGGSDFVELYNRSDKVIDLNSIFISDQDLSKIIAIEESYLLFPQEYVVLSERPNDIISRYQSAQATHFLATDLPSLPDKSGSFLIYRPDNLQDIILIDAFEYSNTFHSSLLDDENGVSLERLNPNGITQDRNNWHSASTSVGFATPSIQNSQFFQPSSNPSTAFSLEEKTISPNDDGFQDLLILSYQVDQVGYLANIRIFDAAGRAVQNLAQNDLIATQGAYKWDGTLNDGSKARMGVYIMHIEYFTPTGETRQEQLNFVVARQL
ncbi:MAG: lamin tail domain-containing protein [Bacteroidota bacterium]